MTRTLTAAPRSLPGMGFAFVLGGGAMVACGAWLASIAGVGWVFVALGAAGVGVGLWGLFSNRLRVRLDADGMEVITKKETIRATFAQVVAMKRADYPIAVGVGIARHLVLLEDGRSFFIPHDWNGARQVIACLARRRFDPGLPFDLGEDDGHQTSPVERPHRMKRFAERLGAEGRPLTKNRPKNRRREEAKKRTRQTSSE